MFLEILWLFICGAIVSWVALREAFLSLKMRNFMTVIFIAALTVTSIATIYGAVKVAHGSALASGIFGWTSLSLWLRAWRAPREITKYNSRVGQVLDVYSNGSAWLVQHADASYTTYDSHGNPIRLTFRDGQSIELTDLQRTSN